MGVASVTGRVWTKRWPMCLFSEPLWGSQDRTPASMSTPSHALSTELEEMGKRWCPPSWVVSQEAWGRGHPQTSQECWGAGTCSFQSGAAQEREPCQLPPTTPLAGYLSQDTLQGTLCGPTVAGPGGRAETSPAQRLFLNPSRALFSRLQGQTFTLL